MDPVTISAIGAGVSALGSFFGQQSANAANAKEAAKARDFNAAEAEKNRQFQDRMSSSSWQRGVKDIEAAGLNPALAYGQGGASSPSGSTGSASAPHLESSLGAGVSSAQRALSMAAQVEQMKAQKAATAAQVSESLARADLTRAQGEQVRLMMAPQLNEVLARTSLAGESATRQKYEASFLMNSIPARTALLQAQWESSMASAQATRALLPIRGTQADLLRLSLPRAKNEAEAAKTWWGGNVSPYLNDAKAVTNIFTPWVPPSR